ncbi:MAG: flavodoxin domain-containing protein, partial [Clostridium sp.]
MKIVYWSGTGNTEAMAEGIAKGIKESGKEAELVNVSNVNIDELLKEDILILGCPAMGDEVLEECE